MKPSSGRSARRRRCHRTPPTTSSSAPDRRTPHPTQQPAFPDPKPIHGEFHDRLVGSAAPDCQATALTRRVAALAAVATPYGTCPSTRRNDSVESAAGCTTVVDGLAGSAVWRSADRQAADTNVRLVNATTANVLTPNCTAFKQRRSPRPTRTHDAQIPAVSHQRWKNTRGNEACESLRRPDDDALGAADVAEPIDVLVPRQLADELGAVGELAARRRHRCRRRRT